MSESPTSAELRALADAMDASEKAAAEKAAFDALTDEQKAELKKNAAADAAAESLVNKPSEEQIQTTAGLDISGHGVYNYVTLPPNDFRALHISYANVHYHHVDTDHFGRWLYRA